MPLLSPLDTSQYHHHTHRHRKRERAKSYCLPPYPVKKNLYPPQTPPHDSPPEIQSCLSLPWPRSGVHKSKRSPPDNSLKIIGRIFFREGGGGGSVQWVTWHRMEDFYKEHRLGKMRRKPMLLLHHVSCPSRWCCVALPCYYDRLVSAAAIRRQVCRRFGVTVSGMGYKVKMLGGRKALGALGWHQGKLLLCSCLCDLVPKWCKKWKAKAAFRFRGLGTMPWTIMVYILVLIISYFSWTHFYVMFVIKKKQKIMTKNAFQTENGEPPDHIWLESIMSNYFVARKLNPTNNNTTSSILHNFTLNLT